MHSLSDLMALVKNFDYNYHLLIVIWSFALVLRFNESNNVIINWQPSCKCVHFISPFFSIYIKCTKWKSHDITLRRCVRYSNLNCRKYEKLFVQVPCHLKCSRWFKKWWQRCHTVAPNSKYWKFKSWFFVRFRCCRMCDNLRAIKSVGAKADDACWYLSECSFEQEHFHDNENAIFLWSEYFSAQRLGASISNV